MHHGSLGAQNLIGASFRGSTNVVLQVRIHGGTILFSDQQGLSQDGSMVRNIRTQRHVNALSKLLDDAPLEPVRHRQAVGFQTLFELGAQLFVEVARHTPNRPLVRLVL